ncbi:MULTISPECIES: preprotein translocase subunit SecG [unclassified Thomasclavelia]|uniref:Protein-export membrane protein SecG n=1 Tax=Candidatus Erysipelatoclostridium merdavium TaxID=2838566 RepID=A0A9D2BNL0_9FIRM|nr:MULTISPECIES: preprotein translocase subunit SecG [unclassified Thomasclavelia]OUP77697.1 preprotein translocase subunit SecG [Erysipelatoclostridium sp. An173]OUQ07093.1 preprotein translocase subunit SecG [Erysipelatoclostridium sp. An15]WRK52299.1 preprotein translocase subunit SecG [Coprobacillaceae bacterium CR2/5/TPMF4]HIX82092.1 preprotein translocase subunit SecG [Candidatus Erysipelatoclostridium merdavium]
MFETVLNGILVAVSIALIILCLLQSGKSDGIVNALTGQSSNLFAHQKERGAELILTRVTAGLAIVFFVIAIILRMS